MAVRVGHTQVPGSSNNWSRNIDVRDFIGEPPAGATGFLVQIRLPDPNASEDIGFHASGDPDEVWTQSSVSRVCTIFPVRNNGDWELDFFTSSATNSQLYLAGWLTEVDFTNFGNVLSLPDTSGSFDPIDLSADAGISDGFLIIQRQEGGPLATYSLGYRIPGESQELLSETTGLNPKSEMGCFCLPLVGGICEINSNGNDFTILGTMLPDQYHYEADGLQVESSGSGASAWPATYPEQSFVEMHSFRVSGQPGNSDQSVNFYSSDYDPGSQANQRANTGLMSHCRVLNDNGGFSYQTTSNFDAQMTYRGGYLVDPGDGGPPQPVPPVLTDPTHENMDDQGADVSVSTNKVEGTMFMVAAIGAENEEQPTAAQIKAGQDATGAPAAFDDSVAVTGSPVQFSITGVENLRVYHYWFVQEDEEDTPLDSNIVGDVFVTFDRDFDPNRVFVNNVPEITDDVVQQAVITVADGEIALGPLNLSSFDDGEIFIIHTYENPEGEVEFTNILNEEKDDDEAPGPKYVQATLADLEGNLIINETGIIWAFYEQIPEVGTPPNETGNWQTDENGVIAVWVNDSALEFGDFGYLALASTNQGWHAIHRVEVYENTDPLANDPGQGQG